MMENNQVLIKKYISKNRAKTFILQEIKDPNLFEKNCTQQKRTSNAIFNMKT